MDLEIGITMFLESSASLYYLKVCLYVWETNYLDNLEVSEVYYSLFVFSFSKGLAVWYPKRHIVGIDMSIHFTF
jgi:hypothetical protein